MKTGLFASVASALLLVSACATGAAAGKEKAIAVPVTIAQSAVPNAAELVTLWEDGMRQERAGFDQVEDGQKRIKDGQKEVRKAQEKLLKAQSKTEDRRALYVRTAANHGKAETPAEAVNEVKVFKKAVDDWKNEYENQIKAQDRLREAEAKVAAGESAVRNGQELITSGREKMRRAEIDSQPRAEPTAIAEKTGVNGIE